MPTPVEAAATIVRCYKTYRIKKDNDFDILLGEDNDSRISQLLAMFELSFMCMRAVAAAKFITDQPIQDRAQEQQLKRIIAELATKAEMEAVKSVITLFEDFITLLNSIQLPYTRVWDKRWNPGRQWPDLIRHAYIQLCMLVNTYKVPVTTARVLLASSSDVINLAQDIIAFANEQIIRILSQEDNFLLDVHDDDLCDALEKLLANYMSPRVLQENEEQIAILSDDLKTIAYNQTMRL